MTGLLDVRTARRRYVTVCVLFWLPLGLTIAPLILLFTERGMAMEAIAGYFAAHSLAAAALELPTGGLSDVLGRRAVLATAGLLNLTALTLLGLGTMRLAARTRHGPDGRGSRAVQRTGRSLVRRHPPHALRARRRITHRTGPRLRRNIRRTRHRHPARRCPSLAAGTRPRSRRPTERGNLRTRSTPFHSAAPGRSGRGRLRYVRPDRPAGTAQAEGHPA